MIDALISYFYTLFSGGSDDLSNFEFNIDGFNNLLSDTHTISLCDWLTYTCAIISLIFIIVLCCLFVYKIVRLIGGLIR